MSEFAAIKVIRAPITVANFLNIHDHPLTVVSMPPTARIIQVICAFYELVFNTIAYTGPTDVGLYYKGTSVLADNIGANQVPFVANASSLAISGPSMVKSAKANFAGLPLELKSPTANYISGNSTGRVTIYWVETFYL